MKKDNIQVSIVIDRKLKARATKLATRMDMSFSQLVRHSLREIEASAQSKKKDQAATRS